MPIKPKPGVCYLVAIDPWANDGIFSLSEGQVSQIMVPTFYQPTKDAGNPVIEDGGFCSVLKCADGKYRCWYMTQCRLNGGVTVRDAVGVAVSDDKVTWTLPDLGTFPNDPTVSGVHNLVWRGVGDVFASGCSVMHAPPGSNFVYLMLYRTLGGLHLVGCTNVEGTAWSKSSDFVLHPMTIDSNWVLVPSIDELSWILISRPDVWGSTGQAAIDRGNQRRMAITRIPSLTAPGHKPVQIVLSADARDKANSYHHFYSFSAQKHPSGLYLAWPHMFSQTGAQPISPNFAWSRDCNTWLRAPDRIDFLPRGSVGQWDVGMTFLASAGYLEDGDDWLWYYPGWDGGHDVPGRTPGEDPDPPNNRTVRTGLAITRRDRIAAFEGPAGGAFTSSRPMRVPDNCDLFLNVDPRIASGGKPILARIMSESRRDPSVPAQYGALTGFAFANCTPIETDSTRLTVSWPGADVRSLAGQVIRLEVYIEDGARYFGWGFH